MEEILRLQEYEPLWDEWRVDKLLYEGSHSNVYQVKKDNAVGVIKVISIPKLQSETRVGGQTTGNQEIMSGYFKEVADVLETELERVSSLKSIPNVLGYQKYKSFERREDVGYDLVILMDKEERIQEYIEKKKKITNQELVNVVRDVAWILDRAHQEGVIHKNIRLDNIFISESGESMLADFSLARKIESFQSRSQKKSDSTYTAPEVLSEYDYNVSTDIYALGVVLYILLNDMQIPSELIKRNYRTELPRPARVEDGLYGVLMKAIAYRPKDRYATASEFFKALSDLKEEDLKLPEDYVEDVELRKKKEEEQRRKLEELKRAEEARKAEEKRLAFEEEKKKAAQEAERQKAERERQEKEAKAEFKARQREEARRIAEEAKRIAKEEAGKKAAQEALKAREEAEQKAKEERLARKEAERQAEEARKALEEIEQKAKKERQARKEIEKKAEEERQAREEIEKKAEEERRAREEIEKKAEEERQAREEIEKKAEEERQAREEIEKKAEEEHKAREEIEKKAEKERQARKEAEKKAEEERRAREEAERKAEEERKAQEERLKEELRIKAEEERIRRAEKKERKEREELGKSSRLKAENGFEEATLQGAAEELETSIEVMNETENEAKQVIKGQKLDADGRPVYDRDADPVKEFTDYSSECDEELLDDVFESVVEMQEQENKEPILADVRPHVSEVEEIVNEQKEFDNSSLLKTLTEQEDGAPEFKIHALETEYSGFFDFEQEGYKAKEEEAKNDYDKSIDQEPYEPVMMNFPPEVVSKKPVVVLLIIVIIMAGGIVGWQNKTVRKTVQKTYSQMVHTVKEKTEKQVENAVEKEMDSDVDETMK